MKEKHMVFTRHVPEVFSLVLMLDLGIDQTLCLAIQASCHRQKLAFALRLSVVLKAFYS